MFFTEAKEGQSVTLKLAIRESDHFDFELNEGLEGRIESINGEEARIRFEFERSGRDWVDYAHIALVELPDYFEEFEEGEPDED